VGDLVDLTYLLYIEMEMRGLLQDLEILFILLEEVVGHLLSHLGIVSLNIQ
jgi:hypothetical protein